MRQRLLIEPSGLESRSLFVILISQLTQGTQTDTHTHKGECGLVGNKGGKFYELKRYINQDRLIVLLSTLLLIE